MASACAEKLITVTFIFKPSTDYLEYYSLWAKVPSTQYPVIITPFLSSAFHSSNNSLEVPDYNIPGEANTTHGFYICFINSTFVTSLGECFKLKGLNIFFFIGSAIILIKY